MSKDIAWRLDMVKKVTLVCDWCKCKFERIAAEWKYAIKNGRTGKFCSISCAVSFSNKQKPRKSDVTRLLPFLDNRKDEFTPFRYYAKIVRGRIKAYAKRPKRSQEKNQSDITLEYLKELWESQKGVCPYTGWQLRLPPNTKSWNEKDNRLTRASLDRIDPSMGYVRGNLQFVSHMANIAKGDFSDDELKEFCLAVAEQVSGKQFR
jgi:YHS domain-containing protein